MEPGYQLNEQNRSSMMNNLLIEQIDSLVPPFIVMLIPVGYLVYLRLFQR